VGRGRGRKKEKGGRRLKRVENRFGWKSSKGRDRAKKGEERMKGGYVFRSTKRGGTELFHSLEVLVILPGNNGKRGEIGRPVAVISPLYLQKGNVPLLRALLSGRGGGK